jgi:alpha-ketoglutarate-dependent 2,4-dichlorophenoxyacetate dioxygenase
VRTAYDDLPQSKKDEIEDLVILHSLWHSRKLAAPGYEASDHEKSIRPGAKHRLVQTDILGRKVSLVFIYLTSKTLYLASHGEEVIGYNYEDSQKIIWDLIDYTTQDKYVYTVNWESKGDMVMVN